MKPLPALERDALARQALVDKGSDLRDAPLQRSRGAFRGLDLDPARLGENPIDRSGSGRLSRRFFLEAGEEVFCSDLHQDIPAMDRNFEKDHAFLLRVSLRIERDRSAALGPLLGQLFGGAVSPALDGASDVALQGLLVQGCFAEHPGAALLLPVQDFRPFLGDVLGLLGGVVDSPGVEAGAGIPSGEFREQAVKPVLKDLAFRVASRQISEPEKEFSHLDEFLASGLLLAGRAGGRAVEVSLDCPPVRNGHGGSVGPELQGSRDRRYC